MVFFFFKEYRNIRLYRVLLALCLGALEVGPGKRHLWIRAGALHRRLSLRAAFSILKVLILIVTQRILKVLILIVTQRAAWANQ